MSQSDYSTAVKEAKDSGLVHRDGEWVPKKMDKKKTMAKKMTKASHIFPKEFRRYSSFNHNLSQKGKGSLEIPKSKNRS